MGGGSMLRSTGRAVATGGGARDVLSATAGPRSGKPPRMLSVLPSTSSALPPLAVASGVGDGTLSGCSDRFVFGPVPSKEEAEEAVFAIQRIFPATLSHFIEDGHPSLGKDAFKMQTSTKPMNRVSSPGSWLDCIKSTLQLQRSKASQSPGQNKVHDAFHLLQSNPAIQKVVVSLSTDEAVWDAVTSNEAVQELKETFYAASGNEPQSSNGGPDIATRIIGWILEISKSKIMEYIEKIIKLVNQLFHSDEREKQMDIFDDVLSSSFMLSVVVFIVVIVARFQRA